MIPYFLVLDYYFFCIWNCQKHFKIFLANRVENKLNVKEPVVLLMTFVGLGTPNPHNVDMCENKLPFDVCGSLVFFKLIK